MARNESDRDDLMSEAVSLLKRIELRVERRSESVVMGFNSLGWLFIYFGADPMYRFDEFGRLRRSYVEEKLYRTTGHTLAEMVRRRSSDSIENSEDAESILLRRDLSDEELMTFRDQMRTNLRDLVTGLRLGAITRQHPVDATGLVSEFEQGLLRVLNSQDFLAPAIVRR